MRRFLFLSLALLLACDGGDGGSGGNSGGSGGSGGSHVRSRDELCADDGASAEVFAPATFVKSVATVGDVVFFAGASMPGAGDNLVSRISKTGGDVEQVDLMMAPQTELSLESHEAHLHYAHGSVVKRVGEAGPPEEICEIPDYFGASVTVGGGTIYVAGYGSVLACPKSGGTAEVLETMAGDLEPTVVAADDENVYYVVEEIPGGEALPTLRRLPSAGGTSTLVASNVGFEVHATDGEAVYFTTIEMDTWSIRRLPFSGGEVETLWTAPAEVHVLGLAAGGDAIYALTASFGSSTGVSEVIRLPKDGGCRGVVVADAKPLDPFLSHEVIAVNDRSVYWLGYDVVFAAPR